MFLKKLAKKVKLNNYQTSWSNWIRIIKRTLVRYWQLIHVILRTAICNQLIAGTIKIRIIQVEEKDMEELLKWEDNQKIEECIRILKNRIKIKRNLPIGYMIRQQANLLTLLLLWLAMTTQYHLHHLPINT